MMASTVLNAHTNMNGLSGPIQLTKLKLKIRINTPVISIALMLSKMNPFTRENSTPYPLPTPVEADNPRRSHRESQKQPSLPYNGPLLLQTERHTVNDNDRIHHAQLAQSAELLSSIFSGKLPADKQMELYFRAHRNMGKRDRGFVAETVYGVIRDRRFLEWGLVRDSGAMPDERELVAAYLMTNSGWSVRTLGAKGFEEFAKRASEKARGIVRRDLPFSLRNSVPDWLGERLVAQYGEAAATELAQSLNRPATLDLRVNTIKATREQALERLAAEEVAMEPTPFSPVGLRRNDRAPLFQTKTFQEGLVEVQDEGSQLISFLLEVKRRDHVADFCAGAGGKSLHLAALMENTGSLYAFDISESRLANLKPRIIRAGLDNLRMIHMADEHDPALNHLAEKMDRVLVDAPCSGTGTLRRNPDIKWRPFDLEKVTATQIGILSAAANLVKPGGRLVYATCSLLREENEDVVANFLHDRPDFEVVPANEVLARLKIEIPDSLTSEGYLRLSPNQHRTDGFCAAVLSRKK